MNGLEKKRKSRRDWYYRHRDRIIKERREKYKEKKYKSPEDFLLCASKYNAKWKGIEHSISKEDIIIPTNCPIFGIELKTNSGKRSDNSPSLDRIDNTKGYVKGNIKVISWKANRLKAALTKEEIEKILKYINNNGE